MAEVVQLVDLTSMNNLAMVLAFQGNDKQAEEMHQRASIHTITLRYTIVPSRWPFLEDFA